jgi:hypothetical protein
MIFLASPPGAALSVAEGLANFVAGIVSPASGVAVLVSRDAAGENSDNSGRQGDPTATLCVVVISVFPAFGAAKGGVGPSVCAQPNLVYAYARGHRSTRA